MGLEEKEAEQKQLALLLGDDAQKLSFETKLYLTELRDEEKSQKRAELAHISWRTGRLRSAHQEVDSEVHKCGNQAASLARALSGPRFAAAEDDRYGEPVRVLDDMDGQRRKLQNVEEWRQKLVDLRALLDFIAQECELTTGQKLLILSSGENLEEAIHELQNSSNEQMKKMLPRGVSEGLLKGSDESSNGSREAAPDAIKSKNEHARRVDLVLTADARAARVFFGRSQLLWTMITRWQDIHDSWVSQPLSSFDAEELDAESRLFARESTALEMRLHAEPSDDADYRGVIHHAAGDEDEERTPGAAILPRAGGAARRLVAETHAFRALAPIVLELKNPNLRKRHWARIAMEVVPGTAAPLVFDPDKTSLGDLFDCGISKHRDIITKVATDATAEAQIELSIHALDAAWEATVLPVLKIDLNEHNSSSSDDASTSSDEPPPAGNNGEPAAPDTIYELGPLDDVANLANDHRAAFRAIAMGEHGMALKPLITVWRQRLDKLTDALRAADDLDRKQRALKPMLAGEREGALAHAWARFNNVHNRWHELLKEIHADPRPMRLIAPPAEAPEDQKRAEKRRSHKAPKHRARGGRPPELDAPRGSRAGDAPAETPEDAAARRDSAALAGFLNMPEPPSDLKLKQWKLDVEVLDEIKAELKDHLEMKRVAFPRFYYLSDLDLISALGNLRNQGSQTLSHVVLALPALFDAVVTLDRSLEPESDGEANSANSSEKGGRPGSSSDGGSAPKGAMSMLLGNLKEARPSLSDAEKRRKRSERKASKRRSGRKSATGRRRQKPQKIGALVDAHGERLILPNPVEVYGGVEVWLRELEREMREALRASFAAVARRRRQEKKRSKRRTSRSPEAVAPCQITLLCERMRWTEDVGDALSTSFRRGSCEPCDECFAKYRDEAGRKARAIREGAVRLAPGEEPPEFRDDERARRSGDEALVLLALQHRDVADDVARAAPHMKGLDDYAWQSKLRFYPAGTLEARSRMSKIGGHIGRRTSEMIVPTAASGSATKSGSDPGGTRVIQRRFNVNVPRARVSGKASALRERSER